MKSEPESLFPIGYALLRDKDRIERLSVRRIESDKMEFSPPRDDDVFPKIFPGSCLGNFETEDSHCEVLKRFQAE